MRWAGGVEMQYRQDPYPEYTSHKWKDYHNYPSSPENLLSKNKGAHIHLSSLGGPTWRRWAPWHLALKTSRAHVWESRRAVGNRLSSSRVCAKSHMLWVQSRGRNLKEVWIRITGLTWIISQRGGRQLGLSLGIQTRVVATWGSSVYYKDSDDGKCYSNPPSSLSALGRTCPPAGWH